MNDNIQQLIKASIYKSLPSHEEKIILEYLKSIPEIEAYEILKLMVDEKSQITIAMAKKVLHTRNYVTQLFNYGIVKSNAQSIKLWLEFAIPKLGFKSVVRLIEDLNDDTNRLIEKAVYWLPLFVSKNETTSWNLLEKLKEKPNCKPI
ncbi:hypothetical protein VF14_34515 [Nostoc linckia z18]|uniref:Uncharacterized protein n=3 Tax=Nostoc linckia TaxID=92942 RepID=A0A9Q5Z4P5_NOSLI|nr:hypothetical protein [Nostoc linckia]PHK14857.1 hypothetical protein VF11_29730 [Nostoc linckia z14]PHK35619.1 hypothetical protein VF12_22240 [Nostoc linckia z15]PHK41964.1 hypothetical protein VF13_30490 [Nostoc linckia z16]PHJ54828.1 hypothetical protein VF02_36460 [Nostoc linckia z1]PHJ56473.1 hypothetical protein VF05_37190 [Nostoc linckia z3]